MLKQNWDYWINSFSKRSVKLFFPKFTLRYELLMNDVLKALGMEIAFDPNRADFTNMYKGLQRLYISKVKHKTFVEVNEEGTEAAAVTSIEIGVKAISLVSDGESTCSPYLYETILRAKANGLDIALGTNGYLLKLNRLEESLPALTYLRFNFSAGQPQPYPFRAAVPVSPLFLRSTKYSLTYKFISNICQFYSKRCLKTK